MQTLGRIGLPRLSAAAHDIAADYVEHGIGECVEFGHAVSKQRLTVVPDVTIYQRDSTYIMTTKEGMPRMLGRTSPAPLSSAVRSSPRAQNCGGRA